MRHGEEHGVPLIVLHGGPGFPHNYLLTLEALKETLPVVFYDQFGCGRSPAKEANLPWTTAQFVQEIKALLKEVAPHGAHLLGHSWGAVPALKAALTGENIRSLILASPFISAKRWLLDATILRSKLPHEIQAVLWDGEESGEMQSSEYLDAQQEYYHRFVDGSHRFQALVDEARKGAGREVYTTMWGPNEFVLSGQLKNCELAEQLGELKIPVLYTCGRNDEASPETIDYYASRTPNAQTRVFELSAHNPHLSESTEYLQTIREFLKK